MLILSVDTSGPSCGVALLRDGLLLYEATANNRLTHSASLMPMVDEALQKTGESLERVDCFACVVGPGSFTGVRIGVSAVKGFARALGKPCGAVDALEALALGVSFDGGLVCPIRDARVQQVYGAAFRRGERLMQDSVLKLDAYLEAVQRLGEQFLFVGDGVPPCRAMIERALGGAAHFAPAHLNELKAGAAAQIAAQQPDAAVEGTELAPLYLRAPQAERERMQRERHG